MEVPVIEKKRFIESSSFFKNKTSANPFVEMKIMDTNFLDDVPSRSPCPKCNRSRKYYCYTCYVAVQEVSDKLPLVKLPVYIDIIKHPKEVDGKSTSAHAAVLAPYEVKIYIYPDFPSYDTEKVLLIFPGKSAIPFKDWWKLNVLSRNNEKFLEQGKYSSDTSTDELKSFLPFTRVIFIDSTWRQTKALYNDPRLKNLPCVMLPSHTSLFWRHQRGKPDTYLATIEAIYYFLVEFYNLAFPDEIYNGEYDNLLFFFKHTYFLLKDMYRHLDNDY